MSERRQFVCPVCGRQWTTGLFSFCNQWDLFFTYCLCRRVTKPDGSVTGTAAWAFEPGVKPKPEVLTPQ